MDAWNEDNFWEAIVPLVGSRNPCPRPEDGDLQQRLQSFDSPAPMADEFEWEQTAKRLDLWLETALAPGGSFGLQGDLRRRPRVRWWWWASAAAAAAMLVATFLAGRLSVRPSAPTLAAAHLAAPAKLPDTAAVAPRRAPVAAPHPAKTAPRPIAKPPAKPPEEPAPAETPAPEVPESPAIVARAAPPTAGITRSPRAVSRGLLFMRSTTPAPVPARIILDAGTRIWIALTDAIPEADGNYPFRGSLLLPVARSGATVLARDTGVSGTVSRQQGKTSVRILELRIGNTTYRPSGLTAEAGEAVNYDAGEVLETWTGSVSIYEFQK